MFDMCIELIFLIFFRNPRAPHIFFINLFNANFYYVFYRKKRPVSVNSIRKDIYLFIHLWQQYIFNGH